MAMADLRKTIEETMQNMNFDYNKSKSMYEESKVGISGLISGEEKLRVAQHHHNHSFSNSNVSQDEINYSEDMTKRNENLHYPHLNSLAETANTNS